MRRFSHRFSRRLTAWIALAAMLFGAVSPALAAALFPDRADILGRMLAIPAVSSGAPHDEPQAAAAAEDDGCPHEAVGAARHEQPSHFAHHGSSGHESHDDSEHAAHGVFCSFCLTANSVVAVMVAPAALGPAQPVEAVPIPGGHERQLTRLQLSGHSSRAPPALS